jgi:response regulator RpfG family c-di-GMP phosphodiesterase
MANNLNVLVVDDEEIVRETLEALIRGCGKEYAPHEAPNGLEALHILRSVPIDFAFIDINMPEMNGLELLKNIRQSYRELLVVIITGQPSYSVVLEALRQGASDFLSKPFTLEELKIALEKLKKERRLREENVILFRQAQEKKILENLNCQLDKKIREQHFLHAINTSLENVRHTGDFYPLILQMALELTDGGQASFMLLDQEHNRLELVDCLGKDGLKTDEIWEAAYQVVINQTPIFISGRKKGMLEGVSVKTGLSMPLMVRGELFGVLNVSKKSDQGLGSEDLFLLNQLAERSALTVENLALYESMAINLYDTLRALVNTLEARDPYSSQHSERVTRFAMRFAQELNLPPEEVDSIRFAGSLHDIGKVGIRDAILLKPGKLLPEEMDVIKTHPEIGSNIVEPLGLLPRERTLILHHHERWDGTGYPAGLAGPEIPYLSRILALADTFDALTSDRPYRRRWTWRDALQEIEANSGTQFDPELVKPFSLMVERVLINGQDNLDKMQEVEEGISSQFIDHRSILKKLQKKDLRSTEEDLQEETIESLFTGPLVE